MANQSASFQTTAGAMHMPSLQETVPAIPDSTRHSIRPEHLDLADATKTCQTRGGRVENVHTPYGDVNLCVFPDGSSVDLRSLSSAVLTTGFTVVCRITEFTIRPITEFTYTAL